MSAKRTPYDGKPYYCRDCGAGLNEFYHCEWPTCSLEDESTASKRMHEHIKSEAERLHEQLQKDGVIYGLGRSS